MKNKLILNLIAEESIDAVLALPEQSKIAYFMSLAETFYPKVAKDTKEYSDLIESYYSSFYVEKLYRSNLFFHEKFTVVYTTTGLIRDITNNLFYLGEHPQIH